MGHLGKGSVFGAVLMITGSCIGVGMLALPLTTGPGGFWPSILLFFIAWLYTLTTGLLLLEANLTCGYRLSLVSIAGKTLGSMGKVATWVLFLFLFYCLGVAYIAVSGKILRDIVLDLAGIYWPPWIGSTLFTLLFGAVLLIGVRSVDWVNRLLMLGLVVSYLVLIFLGSQVIEISYLQRANWHLAFLSMPVLVISFSFHNMVPSLAMYLKGERKRLVTALILGSVLPLFIYFLWQVVMLGLIPNEEILVGLQEGDAATSLLREVVGHSWINFVAQSFALFAIVTSFLTQSLSLVDFLSDGLRIPKVGLGRLLLTLLSLSPPFLLAFLYPAIFLKALSLAGGIAAVLLFGIIPVLMVWKMRYLTKESLHPIVPGGKTLLVIIFLFAATIFSLELLIETGLLHIDLGWR